MVKSIENVSRMSGSKTGSKIKDYVLKDSLRACEMSYASYNVVYNNANYNGLDKDHEKKGFVLLFGGNSIWLPCDVFREYFIEE
jgi:hypothetical protein